MALSIATLKFGLAKVAVERLCWGAAGTEIAAGSRIDRDTLLVLCLSDIVDLGELGRTQIDARDKASSL